MVYIQCGDNMHKIKNRIGLSILTILLFSQSALAATDFSVWTLIGDPSATWGKLDEATKGLILLVTGLGLLALLICAVLGIIIHAAKGSTGEHMDQHGAQSNAFMGQLKTAAYYVGVN